MVAFYDGDLIKLLSEIIKISPVMYTTGYKEGSTKLKVNWNVYILDSKKFKCVT